MTTHRLSISHRVLVVPLAVLLAVCSGAASAPADEASVEVS